MIEHIFLAKMKGEISNGEQEKCPLNRNIQEHRVLTHLLADDRLTLFSRFINSSMHEEGIIGIKSGKKNI